MTNTPARRYRVRQYRVDGTTRDRSFHLLAFATVYLDWLATQPMPALVETILTDTTTGATLRTLAHYWDGTASITPPRATA